MNLKDHIREINIGFGVFRDGETPMDVESVETCLAEQAMIRREIYGDGRFEELDTQIMRGIGHQFLGSWWQHYKGFEVSTVDGDLKINFGGEQFYSIPIVSEMSVRDNMLGLERVIAAGLKSEFRKACFSCFHLSHRLPEKDLADAMVAGEKALASALHFYFFAFEAATSGFQDENFELVNIRLNQALKILGDLATGMEHVALSVFDMLTIRSDRNPFLICRESDDLYLDPQVLELMGFAVSVYQELVSAGRVTSRGLVTDFHQKLIEFLPKYRNAGEIYDLVLNYIGNASQAAPQRKHFGCLAFTIESNENGSMFSTVFHDFMSEFRSTYPLIQSQAGQEAPDSHRMFKNPPSAFREVISAIK